MVDILSARQDISSAKLELERQVQLANQRKQEAEQARSQLEQAQSRLPNVRSQEALRTQKYGSPLQAREFRKKVLGISEDIKSKIGEVVGYEKEIELYKTQQLEPARKQISSYESQLDSYDAQQRLYNAIQKSIEENEGQYQDTYASELGSNEKRLYSEALAKYRGQISISESGERTEPLSMSEIQQLTGMSQQDIELYSGQGFGLSYDIPQIPQPTYVDILGKEMSYKQDISSMSKTFDITTRTKTEAILDNLFLPSTTGMSVSNIPAQVQQPISQPSIYLGTPTQLSPTGTYVTKEGGVSYQSPVLNENIVIPKVQEKKFSVLGLSGGVVKKVLDYPILKSPSGREKAISPVGTVGELLTVPTQFVRATMETSGKGWSDIYKRTISKLPEQYQPVLGTAFGERAGEKITPEMFGKTISSGGELLAYSTPQTFVPLLVSSAALGVEEVRYPEKYYEYNSDYYKEYIKEIEKKELIDKVSYVKLSEREFKEAVKTQGITNVRKQGYVDIAVSGGLLLAAGAFKTVGYLKKPTIVEGSIKGGETLSYAVELKQPIVTPKGITSATTYDIIGIRTPVTVEVTTKMDTLMQKFWKKGFEPKVVEIQKGQTYLTQPLGLIYGEQNYLAVSGRVGKKGLSLIKFEEISGKSIPTTAEELSKLSKTEQFAWKNLIETRVTGGRPVRINEVPKYLKENQELARGYIEEFRYFGQAGKQTRRFQTASTIEEIKGYDILDNVLVKRNIPIKEFSYKETPYDKGETLGFTPKGTLEDKYFKGFVYVEESLPLKTKQEVIKHELGHIYASETGGGIEASQITKDKALEYLKGKYGGTVPEVYKEGNKAIREYVADLYGGKIANQFLNIKVVEEGTKIFKAETSFKEVTKPFSRASGKSNVLQSIVIERPAITIEGEGESVGKVLSLTSKKTPFSLTFQEQTQEQVLKVLPKVIPNIPKARISRAVQTFEKRVGKEVGVGLPSMVGGTGLVSSEYWGTGQYEVSVGGLAPKAQPSIVSNVLVPSEEIKTTQGNILLSQPREEFKSFDIESTKQPSVLKPREEIRAMEKVRQEPKEELKLGLKLQQKLQEKLSEKLQTKVTTTMSTKTKPKIKLVPRVPILFKSEKEKVKEKAQGIVDLFKVYGKRYGEDILLGTEETKEEAKQTLGKFLTGTLGASGKITYRGKPLSFKEVGLGGKEFRPSKRDIFRVVQERGFRLGTGSEVLEIKRTRKKGLKKKWL